MLHLYLFFLAKYIEQKSNKYLFSLILSNILFIINIKIFSVINIYSLQYNTSILNYLHLWIVTQELRKSP